MILLVNKQSEGLPIYETAPDADFEVSIWRHHFGWAWEVEESEHGYGGSEDEGLPTLDAAEKSLSGFLGQPVSLQGAL